MGLGISPSIGFLITSIKCERGFNVDKMALDPSASLNQITGVTKKNKGTTASIIGGKSLNLAPIIPNNNEEPIANKNKNNAKEKYKDG